MKSTDEILFPNFKLVKQQSLKIWQNLGLNKYTEQQLQYTEVVHTHIHCLTMVNKKKLSFEASIFVKRIKVFNFFEKTPLVIRRSGCLFKFELDGQEEFGYFFPKIIFIDHTTRLAEGLCATTTQTKEFFESAGPFRDEETHAMVAKKKTPITVISWAHLELLNQYTVGIWVVMHDI